MNAIRTTERPTVLAIRAHDREGQVIHLCRKCNRVIFIETHQALHLSPGQGGKLPCKCGAMNRLTVGRDVDNR